MVFQVRIEECSILSVWCDMIDSKNLEFDYHEFEFDNFKVTIMDDKKPERIRVVNRAKKPARYRYFRLADGTITLRTHAGPFCNFKRDPVFKMLRTEYGVHKVDFGDSNEVKVFSIGKQEGSVLAAAVFSDGVVDYASSSQGIDNFGAEDMDEISGDFTEGSEIAFYIRDASWRIDCTCELNDEGELEYRGRLVVPEEQNLWLLRPELDRAVQEADCTTFTDLLHDYVDEVWKGRFEGGDITPENEVDDWEMKSRFTLSPEGFTKGSRTIRHF